MTFEAYTLTIPADTPYAVARDGYLGLEREFRDVPVGEVVATLNRFGLLGLLDLAKLDLSLPLDVRAAVAELMVGINTLPSLDATDPRVLGLVELAVPALVSAELLTPEAAGVIGEMVLVPREEPTQDAYDRVRRRQAIKDDDDSVRAAWNRWDAERDAYVLNGGERPVVPLVTPSDGEA